MLTQKQLTFNEAHVLQVNKEFCPWKSIICFCGTTINLFHYLTKNTHQTQK